MMKLMLLTGDPQFAQKAEKCGVDRIFLDLEYINKADRQKGRNTFITQNTTDDVVPLRKAVKNAELLVRVNPIHPHSKEEIDAVCAAGADLIMLPMVYDDDDVKTFVKYCFEHINLHKVYLHVFESNVRAIRCGCRNNDRYRVRSPKTETN